MQHPQSLNNVSRQICTEFGLQYLDDASISKAYQDAIIPEASTSGRRVLVTTGTDSNEHRPGKNTLPIADYLKDLLEAPRHLFST